MEFPQLDPDGDDISNDGMGIDRTASADLSLIVVLFVSFSTVRPLHSIRVDHVDLPVDVSSVHLHLLSLHKSIQFLLVILWVHVCLEDLVGGDLRTNRSQFRSDIGGGDVQCVSGRSRHSSQTFAECASIPMASISSNDPSNPHSVQSVSRSDPASHCDQHHSELLSFDLCRSIAKCCFQFPRSILDSAQSVRLPESSSGSVASLSMYSSTDHSHSSVPHDHQSSSPNPLLILLVSSLGKETKCVTRDNLDRCFLNDDR